MYAVCDVNFSVMSLWCPHYLCMFAYKVDKKVKCEMGGPAHPSAVKTSVDLLS